MAGDLGLLQVIIAAVLFFVMIFGIGFILNMLLKTTHFPIYLYLFVILPVFIWQTWDPNLTFSGNFGAFTYIDAIPAVFGLVGAYISGITIAALRRGGYKMF